MPHTFSPKIVTANALLDGNVIYLSATDQWMRDHTQAELIEDEAHAQLRLLFAQQQRHVVGAFLAKATMGDAGPQPVHFRDAFRATGPSNRPIGKQVGQANV
jgi:hypothetical protein